MSTGELCVTRASADAIRLQAAALSLKELIVSDAEAPADWAQIIDEIAAGAALSRQPAALFDSRAGERRLKEIFAVAALDGFAEFSRADLAALGALLSYVELTQVGRRPAFRPPRRAEEKAAMLIDPATRASLELLETQGGERAGSLLAAIDRTATGPGARLLAARLSAPLTDPAAINARLDAVAAFHADAALTDDLRAALASTPDMARSLTRLSLARAGPRDLAAIRDGLAAARDIAERLRKADFLGAMPAEIADAAGALEARATGGFSELVTLLKEALAADLPLLARDGGFIAKEFDPGLDSARLLRDESRRVIAGLEAAYRERTGIRALKIRHNNVLGYFVETPQSAGDTLMRPPYDADFIHRQTLASAVRFTTRELADLDSKIVRARDEALARELEIFDRLSRAVLAEAQPISSASEAAAALDVALSFAVLAREENYVRPLIDDSLAFDIKGGRHPVVEQALEKAGAARFAPNGCTLSDDAGEAELWLVTGPNMAGKSTFLRQNALIAILAQTGGFAPADAAHIGAADRVFSRVGAADDLARGRSTFMVEMVETAAILNQATARSLVVLDEIGR
ncbi:MAG: DNA mismatch repair protein MutS, partial [Methylocystis sp.]